MKTTRDYPIYLILFIFFHQVNNIQAQNLTLTDGSADVTCFGGYDGYGLINVTGGVSPYTYQWDAAANNQTTAAASGLIAGGYCVTVVDAVGTMVDTCVTISEPTLYHIMVGNYQEATCYNSGDGFITVVPSGGTAPYWYSFNGGSLHPIDSFSNLAGGTYHITGFDANGCVDTVLVVVTEPAAITLTFSNIINNTSNTSPNGQATVSCQGGVGGYTYQWGTSAGNQTLATATGLSTGQHCVTVYDANGCLVIACVDIINPNNTNNGPIGGGPQMGGGLGGPALKVSPNPNNGYVYLQIIDFEKELSIDIYNSLGQMVHRQSCDSEMEGVDLEGLPTGVYYINLMNLEGQINTTKMVVRSD